jgi:hypothetical protein
MPAVPEGTFDTATLLAAVVGELRPVVEAQLAQIAVALDAATAEGASGDGAPDPLKALRADLLRRVLPQFTEAVRAGVVDGMRVRSMHLAQLAAIDRTSWRDPSVSVLQKRIAEEVAKAGVERVTEPNDLTLFQLAEGGAIGDKTMELRVLAPAYLDRESGRVVETGWVTAEPLKPTRQGPTKLKRQKAHERQAAERAERPQAAALATDASAPAKTSSQGKEAAGHQEAAAARAATAQPSSPGREATVATAGPPTRREWPHAKDSQARTVPTAATLPSEIPPADNPAPPAPTPAEPAPRRTGTDRRPNVTSSVARFTTKLIKKEAP